MSLSSSQRHMYHVVVLGSSSIINILMFSFIILLLLSDSFSLITSVKASTPNITIDDTSSITQYLSDIGGRGVCDGIQALESYIYAPTSAQYNSKGELFIIDGTSRIRKVDVNGIISTIAGTGVGAGYNGDGINATLAQLNVPFQLFNSRDEIIISDTNNNRIRKILNNSLSREAYTLAFTASDAMYFTECQSPHVQCNIETLDANGQITILTGDVTTKNGDCLSAIDCYVPTGGGMAVSNNGTGDLYYADAQRVRRLFKNGTIVTISGKYQYKAYNGENIDASLAQIDPYGLVFTPQNEIMFADYNNNRVRKIDNNGKVQTIAGSGNGGGSYSFCGDGVLQATSVPLIGPNGVATNSKGEIIFSDWTAGSFGHVIRKIAKNGIISTIAGTGKSGFNGDGNATLTNLNGPKGVAITSNDEIIFADTNNHRVRKILTNGTIITIAGTGKTTIVPEPALAINSTLNTPTDVAISAEGEILIVDSLNNRIVKILTNGSLITIAGSKTGASGTRPDGILGINCLLRGISGVTVNSKGEILIAEGGNYKIRKILTNGTIITIAGTGYSGKGADNVLATATKLGSTLKVIEDLDHVYILDSDYFRVRKILTNGTIITIAGTGSSGYTGNNLPAQSSAFYNPSSIALKPNGEIVVSDTMNKLIRVISTSRTCNNTLASDELNVCSGNGKCIAFDNCECNQNFKGTWCQEMVDNSTSIDNSTIIGNNTLINNETIISNNTNLYNNSLTTTNGTTINNTNVENSTISNTTNNIENNTLIDNNNSTNINNTIINNSTMVNNTIAINIAMISNITEANTTLNNSTIVFNNTLINNITELNNSTIVNNTTINQSNTTLISNNTNINITIISNHTIISNTTNNTSLVNNTDIINNSTIMNNNTIINNNTILGNNSNILNNTNNSNFLNETNNSTIMNNNTIINNNTNNSTIMNNNTIINNNTIQMFLIIQIIQQIY